MYGRALLLPKNIWVLDCIFETHQLWKSSFSRVYSNCYCNCSFELEIIKIGQSSHNMYSNNILNFQESTTIINACTKKVWKLIEAIAHIYIYIYIYIYMCVCVCVCVCMNICFIGCPIRENVNTLKWIGPQEDLFWSYLFLFNRVSGILRCLQEVKCFIFSYLLIYIVMRVLIRLWFFLIPGFVSAIFLVLYSMSLCICVGVRVDVCGYTFVFFSFTTLLPLYIYIYIYWEIIKS